jgi:hypothetical protein
MPQAPALPKRSAQAALTMCPQALPKQLSNIYKPGGGLASQAVISGQWVAGSFIGRHIIVLVHVLVHDFTAFILVYGKRVPLRCESVRSPGKLGKVGLVSPQTAADERQPLQDIWDRQYQIPPAITCVHGALGLPRRS